MSNRRRSERFQVQLPVRLKDAQGGEETSTLDVSAHGIAVYAKRIRPVRQYVELELTLPGPPPRRISVTAMVARVIEGLRRKDQIVRGLGLEFFLFDSRAKQEWQSFILQVRQQHVLRGFPAVVPFVGGAPGGAGEGAPGNVVQADLGGLSTFLVRPRDIQRLWTFYQREMRNGVIRLEAPQARPPGTTVEVVVVHPTTRSEWCLEGQVLRASTRRSTRPILEIAISGLDDRRRALFEVFVTTGEGMVAEDVPISGDLPLDEMPPSAGVMPASVSAAPAAEPQILDEPALGALEAAAQEAARNAALSGKDWHTVDLSDLAVPGVPAAGSAPARPAFDPGLALAAELARVAAAAAAAARGGGTGPPGAVAAPDSQLPGAGPAAPAGSADLSVGIASNGAAAVGGLATSPASAPAPEPRRPEAGANAAGAGSSGDASTQDGPGAALTATGGAAAPDIETEATCEPEARPEPLGRIEITVEPEHGPPLDFSGEAGEFEISLSAAVIGTFELTVSGSGTSTIGLTIPKDGVDHLAEARKGVNGRRPPRTRGPSVFAARRPSTARGGSGDRGAPGEASSADPKLADSARGGSLSSASHGDTEAPREGSAAQSAVESASPGASGPGGHGRAEAAAKPDCAAPDVVASAGSFEIDIDIGPAGQDGLDGGATAIEPVTAGADAIAEAVTSAETGSSDRIEAAGAESEAGGPLVEASGAGRPAGIAGAESEASGPLVEASGAGRPAGIAGAESEASGPAVAAAAQAGALEDMAGLDAGGPAVVPPDPGLPGAAAKEREGRAREDSSPGVAPIVSDPGGLAPALAAQAAPSRAEPRPATRPPEAPELAASGSALRLDGALESVPVESSGSAATLVQVRSPTSPPSAQPVPAEQASADAAPGSGSPALARLPDPGALESPGAATAPEFEGATARSGAAVTLVGWPAPASDRAASPPESVDPPPYAADRDAQLADARGADRAGSAPPLRAETEPPPPAPAAAEPPTPPAPSPTPPAATANRPRRRDPVFSAFFTEAASQAPPEPLEIRRVPSDGPAAPRPGSTPPLAQDTPSSPESHVSVAVVPRGGALLPSGASPAAIRLLQTPVISTSDVPNVLVPRPTPIMVLDVPYPPESTTPENTLAAPGLPAPASLSRSSTAHGVHTPAPGDSLPPPSRAPSPSGSARPPTGSAPPPPVPREADEPELAVARAQLARAPQSVNAGYRLATLLLRRRDPRDWDDALATLQTLLRIEPNHPGAHHALAEAFAKRSEFVMAGEHLQRARRLGYLVDPKLAQLINEGKRSK